MSKDIPARVYHYTTRERALEHILPTMSMRLSSLTFTNDPRETQQWGSTIIDLGSAANNFLQQTVAIHECADRCRREEWRVFCATTDHPNLTPPPANHPDFTHFKYGHARSRMWAQ